MQLTDTFIVYGLGKSGIATANSILKAGGTVYIGDDQPIRDDILPNAVRLDLSSSKLPKAIALIGAPGIPLTHPKPHKIYDLAKKNNIPIMCDIELFYRLHGNNSLYQFIAITGTNGKSTTTALTTHLLEVAGYNSYYGGNIGVPVFELPLENKPTIYTLEVSSYQADMCFEFTPDAVGFLNFTSDHIDRHGNIEGYFLSKMRLFQNLDKKGQAYIAGHELGLATSWLNKAIDFIQSKNALKTLSKQQLETIKEDIKDNPFLAGSHNYYNALTACALIHILNIHNFSGLKSFKGLPHRTEFVIIKDNIQFINDSKATNADATHPALDAFDNIYWLAGGVAKAEGIIPLLKNSTKNIKHAFFYGQSAHDFYQQAQENQIPCSIYDTLESALKSAHQQAKNDESAKKTILLSPSCASFDQFKNFEHRGDTFKQLVQTLP